MYIKFKIYYLGVMGDSFKLISLQLLGKVVFVSAFSIHLLKFSGTNKA